MEKQIIWRALLAGAAAGVLSFIFARIFVEPAIESAIGYEDGIGAAREALGGASAGHDHGGFEGFTRGVQANIGMGLGVLAFSLAMGALFAVVFAVTYGRVGRVSARLLSLYVAGGMLLSLYLVPALKYPPSPPALSLDETIQQRTLLYLLMVVVSGALFVGAVYLGRQLVDRWGAWNATLAAAGAYIRGRPGRDAHPADHRRDAGAAARRRGQHRLRRLSRRRSLRIPAVLGGNAGRHVADHRVGLRPDGFPAAGREPTAGAADCVSPEGKRE